MVHCVHPTDQSEGAGRRKQWSKSKGEFAIATNPSSVACSTVSNDSLDSHSSTNVSDVDNYGFQQRIVRFDEEPPRPPSVSLFDSMTHHLLIF